MKSSDSRKVTFIGCGKVGMTAAFATLLSGVTNEIVLLSRCVDKIIGEELDLEHALSFLGHTDIKATEDYRDIANSDVVVISAGVGQKPGDTRLDLAAKNVDVIKSIIPKVVDHAPDAVIIMITNPVDVLTYQAYQMAGLPKGRIFGSGTVLDTARLRFHLSEFLHVNPKSIHAYILGEHGDSSFPALAHATVGGQALATFPEFSMERAQRAYQNARNAAYRIIESKGATYYAIGVVISQLIENVLTDARTIMPVSVPLHGQYGHHGVSISVPCVVGKNGVEEILETKLSWEEKQQLAKSVGVIKSYL